LIARISRNTPHVGRRHRGSHPRVGGRVGQALAGGHGDLADQPREQPAAAGVLRALAVHDVLELQMSGHGPRARWVGCNGELLSGLSDCDNRCGGWHGSAWLPPTDPKRRQPSASADGRALPLIRTQPE
jgi:hypothetical protein